MYVLTYGMTPEDFNKYLYKKGFYSFEKELSIDDRENLSPKMLENYKNIYIKNSRFYPVRFRVNVVNDTHNRRFITTFSIGNKYHKASLGACIENYYNDKPPYKMQKEYQKFLEKNLPLLYDYIKNVVYDYTANRYFYVLEDQYDLFKYNFAWSSESKRIWNLNWVFSSESYQFLLNVNCGTRGFYTLDIGLCRFFYDLMLETHSPLLKDFGSVLDLFYKHDNYKIRKGQIVVGFHYDFKDLMRGLYKAFADRGLYNKIMLGKFAREAYLIVDKMKEEYKINKKMKSEIFANAENGGWPSNLFKQKYKFDSILLESNIKYFNNTDVTNLV